MTEALIAQEQVRRLADRGDPEGSRPRRSDQGCGFNKTGRTEVLDAHLFEGADQAREIRETYLQRDNKERSPESLGNLPSSAFCDCREWQTPLLEPSAEGYGIAKAEKQAGHAGALLQVARLMRKMRLDDAIGGEPVKSTVGDKAMPCSLGRANRQAVNGGVLKVARVLAKLH